MQVVDKVMMFMMAVSDMPKAKAFYADKLGLKVTPDYRQDDDNWYVTLTLPEGGASITPVPCPPLAQTIRQRGFQPKSV